MARTDYRLEYAEIIQTVIIPFLLTVSLMFNIAILFRVSFFWVIICGIIIMLVLCSVNCWILDTIEGESKEWFLW